MGELRSAAPGPRLDLNNFDSADAERSRYVLTSPRSLESCARLGIKPVELLIKSLNDLIAERRDLPFDSMRVVHESYEKERLKLLQMCREERERIIQAAGDRWPAGDKVSGLEAVPETKLKDHSRDRRLKTRTISYADLCSKGKSVSTCSNREPDSSTVCSFSLGDLRHTPATELLLDRLTNDINKEMCVTVSERDRKIAALMLVKHQEEQALLKLSYQEEQQRKEARRLEEAQRAQDEKNRRKKLKQSMQRWHEELEARKRLREQRAKEKAVQLEMEVLLQEDRRKRLIEEVDGQRREKIKAAQKEAGGRKRYQEKLLREKEEVEEREREKERQVAEEKEQRAKRSRVLQEKKERQRLQEENRRELLRHILLKQQVEQRAEEVEAQMRSTLEKKLLHSCKKRVQVVEARLMEMQERAAREEAQMRRARQRAELQSNQQLTQKQILVELSRRRTERATEHASAQQRSRALQTQQHNKHRQLCHQRLRERIQREEEAARRVRESRIFMKEWRRERLRRQREQMQEEAHRLARASFHMRERVRQQTHRRTFDQMALEAQLNAPMSRLKL
ncbi:coiled-coil domain-containing protein 177 [Plectropomus leopardus]|uniref:coiled-coil domain-containing protein 177 n=1 Tax=Plectropomus leopardus TaxID=160734 RepID=UPI001C4B1694|nr:coiled-coil domain-containing protein 177 [Plectropomus leopardus]